MKLKESVLGNLNEAFSLGGYGVLRYQGRLCVHNIDGLRNWILEEAHVSAYSIHPCSTKMYHDLREVFLCEGLKKDIVQFISKCPNCTHVTVKHQTVAYYKKSKFLLGSWKTSMWIL